MVGKEDDPFLFGKSWERKTILSYLGRAATLREGTWKEHIHESKNLPTYPWNIPQAQKQQFMKEFLSFGGLGRPGVCSRGMLGFS